MSKEHDFHRLIEQQDTERKEELWKRIESQIEEDDEAVTNSDNTLVLTKGRVLNPKYLILISSLFLFITVLIIVTVIIVPKNKPIDVIDNLRYCQVGDYYIVKSDDSIGQYVKQNDLDILFFDWYNEIDFYESKQIRLNDTDEVICLNEEMIDINGYYLFYYVTDNKTELDLLSVFSSICIESTFIDSTEVKWSLNGMDSYAMFTYKEYNYYLKVEEVFEPDYLLDLVRVLLS